MASPAAQDKVQVLQRTPYRMAKADPGRRFHALYDKVHRRDVLECAWVQVRRNSGAAGIDQTTITDVEEYGVSRLLDELAMELKEQTYRPSPARRVWIPKPGSTEQRPLSIPTIRDRVVQAAVKIVIEPVFEADFLPCSFGFRPKRSAHDALQVLIDEAWRGRRWVVETDIASCFDRIPHDGLMRAVEERIIDRTVLKLLRAMLHARVMEHGQVSVSDAGTPQGGVVSPLLANVYLHRVDRVWQTVGVGVLVKAAKTRIVHLRDGGEGFDFLGFHHRWVRASTPRFRHVRFLARWPSDKAMQRIRDRIRELTARRRLLLPVEWIVQDINQVLQGWADYFRYGNSAHRFALIREYALMRLALVVAKRHHRSRGFGMAVVMYQSPNQLGLIILDGTVVAPRPGRAWRGTPNAGGERRR